ncbi:hypothetical protein EDC01DRAFT_667900 [Geopyxis carbonaria]|nr:hypothetical protein EDC01DRAFT_667900 [Geopyxis carbonaria]
MVTAVGAVGGVLVVELAVVAAKASVGRRRRKIERTMVVVRAVRGGGVGYTVCKYCHNIVIILGPGAASVSNSKSS